MLANFKLKNIISTVYEKSKAVLLICINYLHSQFLFGIFKKIDEKFFKFLCVGVINTLFSYFIYALFITIGFCANIALFFQYILGVLWNFKTTGTLVFQNRQNRLLFKFILSYIFTFILNSILLKFLIRYLNEYLAQAILIMPIALISFIILKTFVFKNND